jgi:hypothetical protein
MLKPMVRFGIMTTALLMAVPAHAEMSVAAFLAKADALKAKGVFAMMSSDIGVLKTEVQTAGRAYRTQIDGDKAAGRAPHSCPPPKGKVAMDSEELMGHFRTIPQPQRPHISVKTAFYALMKKKYPCGI